MDGLSRCLGLLAPTLLVRCTIVKDAIDPDGDPVVYRAAWQKNGVGFAGATSTVFSADTVPAGAIGDSFVCTVTATDGEASTVATSNTAKVTCDGAPMSPP